MIFQREACQPIQSPSIEVLGFELSCIKSSFAYLERQEGAYLQVAGGPDLFLPEHRNSSGQHHRAKQVAPQVSVANGSILQFSGGNISMSANEWFVKERVLEVFSAFMEQRQWPSFLHWQLLRADFTRDC